MDEQFEKARCDKLEELICNAETGKAEVYKSPGKQRFTDKLKTAAEIDDDFFHSTSHVDKALREKIEKGLYVDLAKLLPKEKIIHDDG